MKNNNIQSYYIFNLWTDIGLFIGPVLFAIAIYILISLTKVNLPQEHIGILYFLAVIIFDRSHTMSTIYLTYLNNDKLSSDKSIFIFTPIFLFIIFFCVHRMNAILFWSLVTYFTCYHVIRQQVGFMNYSHKKKSLKKDKIYYLDQICTYGAWGFPFLYLHTLPQHTFGWYASEELILLPKDLGIVFSICFFACGVVFFTKEMFASKSEKIQNLGKIIIFIGTWLCGYFAIYIAGNTRLFLLLTFPIVHAAPYILLVFFHEHKRVFSFKKENLKTFWSKLYKWVFSYKRTYFIYHGSLIFLAFYWENLWSMAGGHGYKIKNQYSVYESILNTLLILPTLTHNTLDGYLWKTTDNFKIKKLLGLAEK